MLWQERYEPQIERPNVRKSTRVLVLEVMDGKKAKNTIGITDTRLFTGGNSLTAVLDPQTMLWSLKYTTGVTPIVFRQSFTSFPRLLTFAEDYYAKRNIRIKEVID